MRCNVHETHYSLETTLSMHAWDCYGSHHDKPSVCKYGHVLGHKQICNYITQVFVTISNKKVSSVTALLLEDRNQ